jgi:predicted nucleotidyltransferase
MNETINVLDTKLSPAERLAVEDLKRRLREALGENLIKIVLYGSKARGDAHRGSDVDILVFVRTYNAAIHDQVYDIAWEVFYANDFAFRISVQIMSEEEWQKYEQYGSSFYRNVKEDGIIV